MMDFMEVANASIFNLRRSPGGGGGGGVENLTLSQTARRTKIHPVTIYLTKNFHAYPVRGGKSFAIER